MCKFELIERQKILRGFRMFQKHGLPLLIDAELLASTPDRLQIWLSSSLAGYVAASESAILTHTCPSSLRDAHFPHCSSSCMSASTDSSFLRAARLANVHESNGVSCRARARVCWMTHFDDNDSNNGDNNTMTTTTMTTWPRL